MATEPSIARVQPEGRPLAVSGMAVVLAVFGLLVAMLGLVAFGVGVSTRFDWSPFGRTFSLALNRWQLAVMLLTIGSYCLWTARRLWQLTLSGKVSGWVISSLLLLRGLLSLLPPIDAGDGKVATTLIATSVLGMACLRRSRPAFRH